MSNLSSAVDEFRIRWASRFVDSITVTRLSDRGTYNAATYRYDAASDTTPYDGLALIRPFKAKGETDLFGEQLVTGKTYSIFVPYTAVTGDFLPEDLVTINTSMGDPDLAGKTMRVLSQQHDSYLTRIELICRFDEGA